MSGAQRARGGLPEGYARLGNVACFNAMTSHNLLLMHRHRLTVVILRLKRLILSLATLAVPRSFKCLPALPRVGFGSPAKSK
jgi:hypothetical protein